jgi:hypothetical protein
VTSVQTENVCLTSGLTRGSEPRGSVGLVGVGQGLVAAGALPVGKGGSEPLSPGVPQRRRCGMMR